MAESKESGANTKAPTGKKTPSGKKSGASTKKTLMALNQRRSIREKTIIDRLEEFFGRDIPTLNAPLSEYFQGDAAAVRSLALRVNRYDGFHDDRLGLDPADFHGITTIGAIVNAIVVWYIRAGWNVIHR
jgi:hypothetical protein